MPIFFLIGTVLSILLAFGPTFLIAFSDRTSGWCKAKWAVFSLLPLLVSTIMTVVLLSLIREYPNVVLELDPVTRVIGFGGWAVYLLFKRKTAVIL